MPLSRQRKTKCLEIIDSLLRYKISSIFSYPVDPVLDHCSNYFEVIKKPMDLGTVRNNLLNDKYQSFSEFCADVDQIWTNAHEYNGDKSIITTLAEQMKIWFHQMIFLMSNDEVADWITQLHDLQNQVSVYSNRNAAASIQIETGQQSNELFFNNPEKEGNKIKKNNDNINTQSDQIDDSNADDLTESESNIFFSQNENIDVPNRRNKKTISSEEMIELHRAICQLDDEEKLLKVLNIIKKNEPQFNVNEKSVIDMNDLSMKTRVKLYNFIQKAD